MNQLHQAMDDMADWAQHHWGECNQGRACTCAAPDDVDVQLRARFWRWLLPVLLVVDAAIIYFAFFHRY